MGDAAASVAMETRAELGNLLATSLSGAGPRPRAPHGQLGGQPLPSESPLSRPSGSGSSSARPPLPAPTPSASALEERMAAAARLVVAAVLVAGAAAGQLLAEAANGTDATAAPGEKSRKEGGGFGASSGLGPPALRRALYVFAGLCVIAALYYLGGRFLRKRKPPRKKYGLLSNSEDNVEMASLESDEDTLFESRNMRR
ncbi:protein FAM174C [Tiliqua scincoides]|uniref:protein FAM174C n=1 Tax=Tiliqua scincoides TaxID=71010 RepID=UPI003462722B